MFKEGGKKNIKDKTTFILTRDIYFFSLRFIFSCKKKFERWITHQSWSIQMLDVSDRTLHHFLQSMKLSYSASTAFGASCITYRSILELSYWYYGSLYTIYTFDLMNDCTHIHGSDYQIYQKKRFCWIIDIQDIQKCSRSRYLCYRWLWKHTLNYKKLSKNVQLIEISMSPRVL